jgi:hypothetical protein
LPESPEWQRKKDAGQLKRPSLTELFSPALIRTTVVTTIVFAASYGLAFGAIQQLPQILGARAIGSPVESGHPEILAEAKEAMGKPLDINQETGKPAYSSKQKSIGGNISDKAVATVSWWQEIGGLLGRALLAVLAVAILGRRNLLRIFQIPALIVVPTVFYWMSTSLDEMSLQSIKFLIALCGILVVAQFSFWGNYIPLVFPVHLRGTGESFAANIGGRVIGTAAAFFAQTLSNYPSIGLAKASAIIAGVYAIVGVIATHWLPEPSHEVDEA